MSKNKEKKEFYKKLSKRIQEDVWLEELKQVGRKRIRESLRMEFDRIMDKIKGIDDEIVKVQARLKDDKEDKKAVNKELEELYNVKHGFELDADNLKEQMMGKYIEAEKCYHGGIDEELKSYQKVVGGRQELKELVDLELMKL